MSMIPLVASVDEIPEAVRYATLHPSARWFVATRCRALGQPAEVPDDWGVPVVAAVAQFTDEQRAKFAAKGIAMSDGSYPIPDSSHIRAAVDDYNRTQAGEDVKKHIIQRAVALDATAQLPPDWVDPDGDGDNDLVPEYDTDNDDGDYRRKMGLTADIGSDVRHGFDEALHPRGKDGRFIEKNGHVVVDFQNGTRVEGIVKSITPSATRAEPTIHVRPDHPDPNIERKHPDYTLNVAPSQVSQAPIAEAHIGGGTPDYGQHADAARAATVQANAATEHARANPTNQAHFDAHTAHTSAAVAHYRAASHAGEGAQAEHRASAQSHEMQAESHHAEALKASPAATPAMTHMQAHESLKARLGDKYLKQSAEAKQRMRSEEIANHSLGTGQTVRLEGHDSINLSTGKVTREPKAETATEHVDLRSMSDHQLIVEKQKASRIIGNDRYTGTDKEQAASDRWTAASKEQERRKAESSSSTKGDSTPNRGAMDRRIQEAQDRHVRNQNAEVQRAESEARKGPFRTITEIKKANAGADHHFFDKSSMQFFNSKVESPVIHGRYFVTSEHRLPEDPKKYTVRMAHDDGHIETIGEHQQHDTLAQAKAAINAHHQGVTPADRPVPTGHPDTRPVFPTGTHPASEQPVGSRFGAEHEARKEAEFQRAMRESGGSGHPLHGIATSVGNKGGDSGAAHSRVNAILQNPDHAAAHSDLNKLMSEAKLSGHQRARYREMLSQHHEGQGPNEIRDRADVEGYRQGLLSRYSHGREAQGQELSKALDEHLAKGGDLYGFHETAKPLVEHLDDQHAKSLGGKENYWTGFTRPGGPYEGASPQAQKDARAAYDAGWKASGPNEGLKRAREVLNKDMEALTKRPYRDHSAKDVTAAVRKHPAGTPEGDAARAEQKLRASEARPPQSVYDRARRDAMPQPTEAERLSAEATRAHQDLGANESAASAKDLRRVADLHEQAANAHMEANNVAARNTHIAESDRLNEMAMTKEHQSASTSELEALLKSSRITPAEKSQIQQILNERAARKASRTEAERHPTGTGSPIAHGFASLDSKDRMRIARYFGGNNVQRRNAVEHYLQSEGEREQFLQGNRGHFNNRGGDIARQKLENAGIDARRLTEHVSNAASWKRLSLTRLREIARGGGTEAPGARLELKRRGKA